MADVVVYVGQPTQGSGNMALIFYCKDCYREITWTHHPFDAYDFVEWATSQANHTCRN